MLDRFSITMRKTTGKGDKNYEEENGIYVIMCRNGSYDAGRMR